MSAPVLSSSDFEYACVVVGARGAGQDRAVVVVVDGGLVIVLADGAGGTAHGGRAAQLVVDAAVSAPADPVASLASLQATARWDGGQTTAVVAMVTRGGIAGASVGDSGAWLIHDARIEDLTHAQHRKPLLGAGATPVRFQTIWPAGGVLLVASDGLFRYASASAVARVASGPDLAAVARGLVALVRLPSGGLQDDVALVLCRDRPNDS